MSEMMEESVLNVQQEQPPVETSAEANEAPVTTDAVADMTATNSAADANADADTGTSAHADADNAPTELALPFDLGDDSKKGFDNQVSEEIAESTKLLMNRLSRVEGQIRGVKRMLANQANIIDILIQSTAVFNAVNSFNKKVVETYIYTRVLPEVQQGNMESVDELITALNRIIH